MPRLLPADVDHGRDHHALVQAAAANPALGCPSARYPFQRNFRAPAQDPAEGQLPRSLIATPQAPARHDRSRPRQAQRRRRDRSDRDPVPGSRRRIRRSAAAANHCYRRGRNRRPNHGKAADKPARGAQLSKWPATDDLAQSQMARTKGRTATSLDTPSAPDRRRPGIQPALAARCSSVPGHSHNGRS